MSVRKAALLALSAVVGAGALLAPAASASSSSPVSGDRAAIAYYRAAVKRTNELPVLRDVYHGFYWLYDDASTAGPKGRFYLDWGVPKKPASFYVAATGTYVVRLSGGRESWFTLTIAPTCASGHACASRIEPFELYVTKHADYWGYISKGAAPACWNHASGNSAWLRSDFYIGNTGWWTTEGDYRPIVHQGSNVLITSIYPVSDGAKVTEVDTITATKHFKASTLRVSRSTHPVYAAHHYSISETDPLSPPKPPKVHICP